MSANKKSTGQKTRKRFGGYPSNFPVVDLPTYADIYRLFYKLSDEGNRKIDIIIEAQRNLLSIWHNVNPRLPLIQIPSLTVKLARAYETASNMNYKRYSKKQALNAKKTLNKLFDISACSCKLEKGSCGDKRIECRIEQCTDEHLICSCLEEIKVPVEDRAYLRDQRSKVVPVVDFDEPVQTSPQQCKKKSVDRVKIPAEEHLNVRPQRPQRTRAKTNETFIIENVKGNRGSQAKRRKKRDTQAEDVPGQEKIHRKKGRPARVPVVPATGYIYQCKLCLRVWNSWAELETHEPVCHQFSGARETPVMFVQPEPECTAVKMEPLSEDQDPLKLEPADLMENCELHTELTVKKEEIVEKREDSNEDLNYMI